MKKLFIFAAAVATMASCAKNEVETINIETADNTISFENVYGRTTKSANSVDYDNAFVMGVSSTGATYNDATGYYEGGTASAEWYLDDVLLDDDSSATVIAPYLSGQSYYWPVYDDTTLEFMAFAPSPYLTSYPVDGSTTYSPNYLANGSATVTEHDGTEVTYEDNVALENIAEGYVTFTFLSVDGSAELTAAAPCRTYTLADKESYVPLSFKQMLSRIRVIVALDEEFTDVLDYEIDDVDTYLTTKYKRGIYTIAVDERYPSDKVADAGNSVMNFYQITYPETSSEKSYDLKNQYASASADYATNIVPQTASGVSIAIENLVILNSSGETVYDQSEVGRALSYKIKSLAEVQAAYETAGGLTTDADYAALTADIPGDRFDEGYYYTITLTISPSDLYSNGTITFSTAYTTWTSSEVGFTY